MTIRIFIKPYYGWCHKAQRWLAHARRFSAR